MKKMKRILAAVICLMMMAAFAPTAGAAIVSEGMCGENVSWKLNYNGVLTISGTGDMSDTLVVDEETLGVLRDTFDMIDNADAVEVVVNADEREQAISEAFGLISKASPWAYSGVKSVVIEDGVTSIGAFAFFGCTTIESVEMADSVKRIEMGAFFYCTSLASVKMGNGVTTIDSQAFFYCTSLTDVTIPDSVKNIGGAAFAGCSALVSVTIPEGVTRIGVEAFEACTALTNVEISDGVAEIGNYAFSMCTSLKNVMIPKSVKNVPVYAFSMCTSLESVTIAEGVTSIGAYAFWDCSALVSAEIPESVTSIGACAFYNCTSLVSVKLPERAPGKTIKNWTFYGCSALSDDYFAEDGEIAVMVDFDLLILDSTPYIKDGRTLVPMRAIFEALGCSVEWNNEERSVTAVSESGSVVKLAIGDNVMYVNGEAAELDVAAEITNERTFVPLRAVSEAMGCYVEWDNANRAIWVSTDNSLMNYLMNYRNSLLR